MLHRYDVICPVLTIELLQFYCSFSRRMSRSDGKRDSAEGLRVSSLRIFPSLFRGKRVSNSLNDTQSRGLVLKMDEVSLAAPKLEGCSLGTLEG